MFTTARTTNLTHHAKHGGSNNSLFNIHMTWKNVWRALRNRICDLLFAIFRYLCPSSWFQDMQLHKMVWFRSHKQVLSRDNLMLRVIHSSSIYPRSSTVINHYYVVVVSRNMKIKCILKLRPEYRHVQPLVNTKAMLAWHGARIRESLLEIL